MARTKIPLTITDLAGNSIAGASVQVRKRTDGTLTTIYQAETGPASVTNPIFTDSRGRCNGWVERGKYNATISASGLETYTEIFNAAPAGDREADELWLPAGAAARVVTALPATGVVGEEVILRLNPGTENGIVFWHFRYDSGPQAEKWVAMGQQEALTVVAGGIGQITSANGITSTLSTNNFTLAPIAAPHSGMYECRIEVGYMMNTVQALMDVGVAVGNPASYDYMSTVTVAGTGLTASGGRTITGYLDKGETPLPLYTTNAGTASFARKKMWLRPLRLLGD